MNTSANILLLIATLATIVLGIFLAAPLPSGPDRAGIGIGCFMLQTPRWICLAVVLGMCVANGAFAWPSDRTVQYVIVLVVHGLLGLASIACGLAALAGSISVVPEWKIRVLTLVPFVIPATQILFATWFLNPALRSSLDATTVRTVTNWTLVWLGALVVIFGSIGATAWQQDRTDTARRQAENAAKARAEAEAKANAEDQGFRALMPESPLTDWFRFTEYGHSEEHRQGAREAILRRPNLAADLIAAIGSTNAEMSMKLMYFVGELPKPPMEVAGAIRERAQQVIRIAQTIDPQAPDSRNVLYEKVHSLAMGVQAAAFGLQRAGVDIRSELRAMAEICGPREKVSPRDIAEGCQRILKYFDDLEKQSNLSVKPL